MSELIKTLHKKGDASIEIYPNIKRDNIPASAINTSKLDDGAITESKLANSCVTNDKLSVGAVGVSNIIDNSVTTAKINDSAITTAKINDGAITTSKIANGSINGTKLSSTLLKCLHRLLIYKTGATEGIVIDYINNNNNPIDSGNFYSLLARNTKYLCLYGDKNNVYYYMYDEDTDTITLYKDFFDNVGSWSTETIATLPYNNLEQIEDYMFSII